MDVKLWDLLTCKTWCSTKKVHHCSKWACMQRCTCILQLYSLWNESTDSPNYTIRMRYFFDPAIFWWLLIFRKSTLVFICLFCWFFIVTVYFLTINIIINTHLFIHWFILHLECCPLPLHSLQSLLPSPLRRLVSSGLTSHPGISTLFRVSTSSTEAS